MNILGKRISKTLEEKGLTQKELSQLTGISEVTIGRYINGKREPNASVLSDIATSLNVTADYLLGNSSNPYLTKRDEVEIDKDIEQMKNELTQGNLRMSLDGQEIDDEIKEFIISNMENTLILAKLKAKEKFTPKKYRR